MQSCCSLQPHSHSSLCSCWPSLCTLGPGHTWRLLAYPKGIPSKILASPGNSRLSSVPQPPPQEKVCSSKTDTGSELQTFSCCSAVPKPLVFCCNLCLCKQLPHLFLLLCGDLPVSTCHGCGAESLEGPERKDQVWGGGCSADVEVSAGPEIPAVDHLCHSAISWPFLVCTQVCTKVINPKAVFCSL